MSLFFFLAEDRVITPGASIHRVINSTSHTLTIPSLEVTRGAKDPDHGRYTCKVCVPTEDGEEECHRSSTILFVASTVPEILKGQVDGRPSHIIMWGTHKLNIFLNFRYSRI